MLDLHKFDCLRANKSTMSWGVEARVPFLDYDFIGAPWPEGQEENSLLVGNGGFSLRSKSKLLACTSSTRAH